MLLLGCAWWLTANSGAASKRDLAVVFLGFTNNPQHTMQPVRVEVVPGAIGDCALFRVTNLSSNQHIRFDTSSVEWRDERGWTPFTPIAAWAGVGGAVWSPGYSCLYAVAWPPGLVTNQVWRMRVSVAHEPDGLREFVNRKLGREVFGFSGSHTITSSEVRQ